MSKEQISTPNILTLDIEDWCQSAPEEFRVRGADCHMPTRRVLANTRRLLTILRKYKTRATCFVLGSVAEAYPTIIREILDEGHEIASHGYLHHPVYTLSPAEFRADVEKSLECLERITGKKIIGFRAPYFSVTRKADWALSILAELGLEYDASILPVHRRFYRFRDWDGFEHARRFPHMLFRNGRKIIELPATTLRLLGQNLPVAGGTFLGILPYPVFATAIRKANRLGNPAVFYLHPHDLDSKDIGQALPGESMRTRAIRWGMRVARSGCEPKLARLLSEYSFVSVKEWLGTAVVKEPHPDIVMENLELSAPLKR